MLALNASSMASMACSPLSASTTSAPRAKRSLSGSAVIGRCHPPRDNGLRSDSVRLRPSMGRVGLYAELHDAVERTAFAEGALDPNPSAHQSGEGCEIDGHPVPPYRRANTVPG